MTIRVVLAEDSLIVREGVRQLLAGDEEIDVVAAVGDMPSVHEACERERPDVVVTDIRMPPTKTDEGIRLAIELRELHPEIGVVVLSQYSDPGYALALLEGGSDGRAYLLKHRVHNRAELTAAIKAVAENGSMIDPHIVDALVSARAYAEHSPLGELTVREREVLAEIAQGKSNTAIAANLFLTKRAVEKHINAIFLKLGLAHSEDVSKRVKAAVMVAACFFLPLSIASGWGRPPSSGQAFWLLGLFAVSIGLPFFALAANGPLLQAWFARTDHPAAKDPYFLYAASNVGSFLALLSYPAADRAADPARATRPGCGRSASVVLIALIAASGALLWRRPKRRRPRPTVDGTETRAADAGATAAPGSRLRPCRPDCWSRSPPTSRPTWRRCRCSGSFRSRSIC